MLFSSSGHHFVRLLLNPDIGQHLGFASSRQQVGDSFTLLVMAVWRPLVRGLRRGHAEAPRVAHVSHVVRMRSPVTVHLGDTLCVRCTTRPSPAALISAALGGVDIGCLGFVEWRQAAQGSSLPAVVCSSRSRPSALRGLSCEPGQIRLTAPSAVARLSGLCGRGVPACVGPAAVMAVDAVHHACSPLGRPPLSAEVVKTSSSIRRWSAPPTES